MHCTKPNLRKIHACRHQRRIQLDSAQQPAHGVLHAVPLHAPPFVMGAQIKVMSLALRRRRFALHRGLRRPGFNLDGNFSGAQPRCHTVYQFAGQLHDLFALRDHVLHPQGRAVLHADRLHAQPVPSRRGKNLPRRSSSACSILPISCAARPRRARAYCRIPGGDRCHCGAGAAQLFHGLFCNRQAEILGNVIPRGERQNRQQRRRAGTANVRLAPRLLEMR